MIIRFHRVFDKGYKKLPLVLKNKVDATISMFVRQPHAPRLRNHALVGSLADRRSISVTGDVRIIYEMEGGHAIVLFLDVGSHSQVYG